MIKRKRRTVGFEIENFERNFLVQFQGYYGDGFTCLPQSSCRHDPAICSPDATCVAAGENQFACVCNEGFAGDGTNCKSRPKHEANFLLVNQGMATLRIPFAPTYEDPGTPIYIAYMQMAIAIDIDCMNGKAYSSDISGKIHPSHPRMGKSNQSPFVERVILCLYYVYISGNRIIELTYNGSMAETFLPKVSNPEGLAIDWVSRNIFWTGKTTVEVANLETKKRKVLVSDGLVNPRGIAVHPYRG